MTISEKVDKNLTDLGDRLDALRKVYLKTDMLTPYHDLDLGIKMIIAAALVELVKGKGKV